MKPYISFRMLTAILTLFLTGILGANAPAAEFAADLTVTSPQDNFVYDLKVRGDLIRMQKTRGPMTVPPFPTIYNRDTGVTWGLNPQAQQYVEETDPVKTMMMNPIAGWAFMRKDMTATPAGTETVAGYVCQVLEYRKSGSTQVLNRVWVSQDLDFVVKEVAYGLNANPTMELKNIKAGPMDAALFEIPPGYTLAGGASGSPNQKVKKQAKAKKPLTTKVLIKPTSSRAIGLEPDRTIIITATGDDGSGAPATAGMKVLAKDKSTLLVETIALQKGESKTWTIPAEKTPYDLYLKGGQGQIGVIVEQRFGAPVVAAKTATVTTVETAEAATPAAGSSGNIAFILDASGSMWGQVEGTAKIAIAKEVLTGLIRDLPDDAVVGLVAYGHRHKGDCDDVEELIPMGPLNQEKMIARIQALSPKGKTPISRSVRLTAERLKGLEDETTIILVSDGKETCDPDPCGLVKDLKASGIKFVMHVIGFDVTEEEREQLECMANAGGGNYYTAGNAGEFLAAAREVVKAPTFDGGYLTVTSVKEGRPFNARVTVYRQSDNQNTGSKSTWYQNKPAEYKLVPGIYALKVIDRSVTPYQTREIRDVEIASGQTVEKTVTFGGAGILRITTEKEGQPFNAKVVVFNQSDKKSMGDKSTWYRNKPAEYKLVPGIYFLKVTDRSVTPYQTREIRDVEIASGQTVEKTITFGGAGILRITTEKEGQPFNAKVVVFNQSDKKSMGGKSTWYRNKPAEYKMVPGIYFLKVTDRSAEPYQTREIRDVEIASGQTVEKTVQFVNAGMLRIRTLKQGQPFNAKVTVFLQVNNKPLASKSTWYRNKPAEYKLVPGIYFLKVTDRTETPYKSQEIREIEILSGQTVEKNIEF